MQQFAIASIKPRSIAWLIRIDEWDHLEEIIKYNCAMMGGYFNVIIPLTDQNVISEEYQHFLTSYDPDLIVLAPNMVADQLNVNHLHPFGIVPWEMVSRIVSLDPLAGGSGISLTVASEWIKLVKEPRQFINAFVAVADNLNLDMSRLALVVCGDTEPREPMWSVMDENVHLDATGYREHFLERFINPSFKSKSVGAYYKEEEGIVPAPDRCSLNDIILEEYKFPMADAIKSLETSFGLQHYPQFYQSFIGLTATHKRTGTPERISGTRLKETADIVILISDSFNMEEAILFWNLRANGVYVSWLSFLEFENNTDRIAQWLASDYTAVYYYGRGGMVFSSPYKDTARLENIVEELSMKRKNRFPDWHTISYRNLISYSYVIPSIHKEHVIVSKDTSKCTFVFKSPLEHSNEITPLHWNGMDSCFHKITVLYIIGFPQK